MKVKAIKLGFYGGSRRRPGDVFEVPDALKGSWFVQVQVSAGLSQEAPKRQRKAKAFNDSESAPEAEQEADGLV